MKQLLIVGSLRRWGGVLLTFVAGGALIIISLFPIQCRAVWNSIVCQIYNPDPDRTDTGGYIHNGGFEDGSWDVKESVKGKDTIVGKIGNEWFQDSKLGHDKVRFDIDDNNAHSGLHCQKITLLPSSSNDRVSFGQSRILPRGYYNFTVNLKANDTQPISIILKDDNKKLYRTIALNTSSLWQKIDIKVYIPKQCLVLLIINTNHPGVLYLDDVEMIRWVDPVQVAVGIIGVITLSFFCLSGYKYLKLYLRKDQTDKSIRTESYIRLLPIILVLVGIALLCNIDGAIRCAAHIRDLQTSSSSLEYMVSHADHRRYHASCLPSSDDPIVNAYHGAGINDNGEIASCAGTSNTDIEDNNTAVILGHGRRINLPSLPGCKRSYALGINNNGIIVGRCSTPSDKAVFWRDNKIYQLMSLPDYPESIANAINNHDVIAGYIHKSESSEAIYYTVPARACVWRDGILQCLDVPKGYKASHAYAINSKEQVVGWAITSNDKMHAVLWNRGKFVDLGTLPGGTVSSAAGINDHGWICGTADTKFGARHIVYWENGRIHDLGMPPRSSWCQAKGINNNGTILINNQTTFNNVYQLAIWDQRYGIRFIEIDDNTDYELNIPLCISNNEQIVVWGLLNYKCEKPLHPAWPDQKMGYRIFLLIPKEQ